MAHPKRKISRTRGGKRRSHNALSIPQLTECKHCHELIRSHSVCTYCGHYKGREIVQVEVV